MQKKDKKEEIERIYPTLGGYDRDTSRYYDIPISINTMKESWIREEILSLLVKFTTQHGNVFDFDNKKSKLDNWIQENL